MSSKWRRYEVLLPLQFNDGRDVPAEWLAESVLEIVDEFGLPLVDDNTGPNDGSYTYTFEVAP